MMRPRIHPALVLGGLIAALMVRLLLNVIDVTAPPSDSRFNVGQAHDLAMTGRLIEGGAPSMYREPLPIAAYALQIVLDPRLDGVAREDVTVAGPTIRTLKQQHVLWSALLLAGVALQAWWLAARRRLLVATLTVLIVHAMVIEPIADYALTELHAAALIVWAGLFGQRWVGRRRTVDALVLGLILGLAVLVKASLLYIGAVHLMLLAIVLLARDPAQRRRVLAGVGVALVAMAMMVVPWMARNAATFDTWSIADRGGLALWSRAIYEDATPEELRGSWYAFSPNRVQPYVGRVLGVDEEDLDGPLRRIAQFHPDEEIERRSFYQLARADRFTGTEAYLREGVPTRAEARVRSDEDLMARGLAVLREDPGLFLSTAPLFLWRGSWPVLAAPLLPTSALALLNPLSMLALLVAVVATVVRPRPVRVALLGLPAGVVAFAALLTIYEPRLTQVALPTMLLLLVLGAERLLVRLSQHRPRGVPLGSRGP